MGSSMTARSIPILFALLAGTVCVSCSRDDAAQKAGPGQTRTTSRATSQKPVARNTDENQNWVILTEADLFGDEYAENLEGIWQPSESEVVRAIRDVRPYLRGLQKTVANGAKPSPESIEGRIGEILANWDKYLCQAVGHTKDGKKLIHLNFFRPEEYDPLPWRNHYYFVFDGGASFWRIEYDCGTNTFLDFETNGDA